jgi:multiple sugar transport system permease protein
MAGLNDIPCQYYEAAKIDGAGVFRRFFGVTLPLLTPVIFFNLVMGIIGAMQMFVLPFMISPDGTPANTMMFYAMYLYRNAFSYLRMGMASAMAWIMFVVIMGLTLFIYWSSGKWVHYMGE